MKFRWKLFSVIRFFIKYVRIMHKTIKTLLAPNMFICQSHSFLTLPVQTKAVSPR